MDGWITALVLTWLEMWHANGKDVWKPFVAKAVWWLSTRMNDDLKDNAVAAARKLLASAI
jgi:hypothetical protein